MSKAIDIRWMSHALGLGARGLGRVWPNPAVGCVIVRDGRVIGRGWTQDGGRPHAEVMALAQAGDARGATAYVTLEPCAHTGKTPPCSQALIAAQVARVVVAVPDPDPRVARRGIADLEAAGIDVTLGTLEAQARAAHQGFFSRIKAGRPMVTLKLASSFDGQIATGSGDSQWITGPEARRQTHAMRGRHDAVWVGAGTARADLPSLTMRGLGATRQPVRIVTSRALELPRMGPLAETAHEVPVWLFHGPEAPAEPREFWQNAGARLFEVPVVAGDLDLSAVLDAMGSEGLTRVFCEGGGQLGASLIARDLADQLVGFTAGVVIGGDGRAGIAAMELNALSSAPRFKLRETRALGGDVMHIWTRDEPSAQTP